MSAMLKILLIVGAGGGLGSMARFYAQFIASKYLTGAFPYGTFFVNVVGSLIIGVVYGLTERSGWLTPEWRFFLATGFCGGFTTFSTFSYENLMLLRNGDYLVFALYAGSSFVCGIVAIILGILLTR